MFYKRMKAVPSDDICSCFHHLLHFGTMVMYKVFRYLLTPGHNTLEYLSFSFCYMTSNFSSSLQHHNPLHNRIDITSSHDEILSGLWHYRYSISGSLNVSRKYVAQYFLHWYIFSIRRAGRLLIQMLPT